ncbi:MAG TPA: helix-turn-helix transcriptional regulator, partial [Tepidiformaceae bacterium]
MQEQASERFSVSWTPRQREVLELIADGYTNREIAERLGISLDGAKWHVSEIISKLGVQSREDAAQLWLRERRRHWPSRMFKTVAAPVGWAAGAVAVAGIVALVLADMFTSEG